MEINIEVDDGYMGKLMADVHRSGEDVSLEALGLLRWAIDMKRAGKVLCLCDRNGQNLQRANVPILDSVRN